MFMQANANAIPNPNSLCYRLLSQIRVTEDRSGQTCADWCQQRRSRKYCEREYLVIYSNTLNTSEHGSTTLS